MPSRLNCSRWIPTQFAAYSRQAWRSVTRSTTCFSLAELLRDGVFDGHAVVVPARHIGRAVALHRAEARHDVFGDLVQRVAQMDVAVAVGRAVVQDKRPLRRVSPDAFAVQVQRVPALLKLRLFGRQIAPLRKRAGVFVVQGDVERAPIVALLAFGGRVCQVSSGRTVVVIVKSSQSKLKMGVKNAPPQHRILWAGRGETAAEQQRETFGSERSSGFRRRLRNHDDRYPGDAKTPQTLYCAYQRNHLHRKPF